MKKFKGGIVAGTIALAAAFGGIGVTAAPAQAASYCPSSAWSYAMGANATLKYHNPCKVYNGKYAVKAYNSAGRLIASSTALLAPGQSRTWAPSGAYRYTVTVLNS